MKKPMTTRDRVENFRKREEKAGRVRREYSATPAEHEELKAKLQEVRQCGAKS